MLQVWKRVCTAAKRAFEHSICSVKYGVCSLLWPQCWEEYWSAPVSQREYSEGGWPLQRMSAVCVVWVAEKIERERARLSILSIFRPWFVFFSIHALLVVDVSNLTLRDLLWTVGICYAIAGPWSSSVLWSGQSFNPFYTALLFVLLLTFRVTCLSPLCFSLSLFPLLISSPSVFSLSIHGRLWHAWVAMAPGDVVTEQSKQQRLKEKRPARRPEAECEVDGTFVFQAQEAWKDFHNSLRQFYEAGELCDVTLKVGRAGSTLC